MSVTPLLFSFRGRINRAKYWLITILSILLVGVVVFAAIMLMSSQAAGTIILAIVLLGILVIGVVWSGLAVGAKRLHDRDKSAWWLLLFYVAPGVLEGIGDRLDAPVAYAVYLLEFGIWLWAFIELGVLRGTNGPNEYGPDPLQSPSATQPA